VRAGSPDPARNYVCRLVVSAARGASGFQPLAKCLRESLTQKQNLGYRPDTLGPVLLPEQRYGIGKFTRRGEG
jgi:hypothetical protein